MTRLRRGQARRVLTIALASVMLAALSGGYTLNLDQGQHGAPAPCVYRPDPDTPGVWWCEYPSQGFTHGGMGYPSPSAESRRGE